MSCGTIVIIDVHHSMLSIVMWNYMWFTPIIYSGIRSILTSKKSKDICD
jgi:hypothetical protein